MIGLFNYGPTLLQRGLQSQAARNQLVAQQCLGGLGATTNAQQQSVNNPYYVNTISTTTSATTNLTTISGSTPTWGQVINNNATTLGLADPRKIVVRDGQEKSIELPDGTIVEVAMDGSFKLLDEDAKVTYRANRVRDFNAYLNASDKLEEFIRFCGEHGVRQDEMLDIPIKLFIGFLIVEAAKADHEPEPDDVKLLPDLRKQVMQPKCVACGRYIRRIARQHRIEYCGRPCFEKQALRLAA